MPKAKQAQPAENKEVALFGGKTDVVPAHLQTEAPVGNENVSSNDMTVPRLNLLQALSDECRTVDGAKPGLLYNTVTGELFESVNLINLFFKKEYAIFKKRKLGGGLEGNFDSLEAAQAHLDSLSHKEDYDIVDTDKHFCLLLDEDGEPASPAVLYMSSSKLKVSKSWNTDIALRCKNADRFAGVWRVSAREEVNRRNEAYYNLDIEFIGWAPEPLYLEAKKLYRGFASETVAEAA